MTLHELKEKLLNETNIVLNSNQLSGQPNRPLNENDLLRIIRKSCDILIIDYSEEQDLTNYTYAIYNPEIDAYVKDREFLGFLIQYIIDNQTPSPKISAKNAISQVDEAIKFSKGSFRKANLPPKYIVKFKNCIYNLKDKYAYKFDDEEIKDYDFVNTIRYSIKDLDDVNDEMLMIVKQVLNAWTDKDKDIEKLIKQIIFSYIEGDGRGVQIILKSDGGDGKSTFLRMIQKLGHSTLTRYMNLDDYNDDNTLNQIQPSTKLILGDDLQSNLKMTNKGLSRFKTLVDGGSINVSEKYMPNKLIQSHALKIQNTNTDIKFFENNDAIRDRVILIEWPHHNFRQNPVEDFDLDQLTGKKGPADKEFMEALLSYVIHTTDYFNKFDVTNKMRSDFDEMLNSNDIIVQYIDELKDSGVLNYSHLPSLILYNHFKQWLKDTNPGSHPMKLIDFTKRFKTAIKNENYTSHKRMRLSQLSKDQFDINIFDNLYIEESAKTAVFINPDLDIESKINEIEEDINNLNKDQIKIKYNESIIRSYLNHVKDKNPADYLILIAPYQTNEINDLDIDTIIEKLIDYYQE